MPMTLAERKRLETLEAWRTARLDPVDKLVEQRLRNLEPIPGPVYTFVDDFTGTTLDTSKWVGQYSGVNDWGDRLDTNMSAAVSLAQTTVKDGIATLTCERRANPSGRSHVGACLSTFGKFAQKYGTFEARLRVDSGERTWPALWLLPVGRKGPYPELDWAEWYGSPMRLGPGQVEHIVHTTPPPYTNVENLDYVIDPLAPGWHDHKMIWTPTRIEFYIDGALSWRYADARVPQVAMYVILTMGVDPVNATGPAPDRTVLEVDYIRVSQ